MNGEVMFTGVTVIMGRKMEIIGQMVVVWCMVAGGLSHAVSSSCSNTNSSQDNVCRTKDCTERAELMKSLMNSTVEPCTNFWQYACGGLNPNSSAKGIWTKMTITRLVRITRLLAAPENVTDPSAVKMTKKLYRSCMNLGVLQKLGDQPLIDVINHSMSHFPSDLTSRLLAIEKLTISPLFSVSVTRYQANSSQYVWAVDGPVLNLPRDSYVGSTAATVLRRYTDFLVKALHRIYPHVTAGERQTRVERVVALEVALATMTLTRQQKRGVVFNSHTLHFMQTSYPDLHWQHYLKEMANMYGVDAPVSPQQVIVTKADQFLQQLFPLVKNTSTQVLHDHFLASAVCQLLPYTAGSLYTLFQTVTAKDGRNDTLASTGNRDWYCMAVTRNLLPGVVGYMYAQAFSQGHQEGEIVQLVNNVVNATKHNLASSPWLSASSKGFILEKLATMRMEVGVPTLYNSTSWLNHKYDGVSISPEGFLRNAMVVKHREARWLLLTLLKPPQCLDWDDATLANAFYRDLQNGIILPLALLQPPVFSPSLPDALNYGCLGMMVGHEISHALDFRGQQYDLHGNLRGQSPLHHSRDHMVRCLLHQFQNFTFEGVSSCLNGSLTWNENFADSAGLSSAYTAYESLHSHRSTQKTLPGLTHLSPDQLFFLSFAQIWCAQDWNSASFPKFCGAGSDEHSPNDVRALATLINTPQFARAFRCPRGSPMNPLRGKCPVWRRD